MGHVDAQPFLLLCPPDRLLAALATPWDGEGWEELLGFDCLIVGAVPAWEQQGSIRQPDPGARPGAVRQSRLAGSQ